MEESTTQKQINEMQEVLSEMGLQIVSKESMSEAPDSIAIKLQLINFVKDIYTHNQGVDWEVNKARPKPIRIPDIINESQKLFEFIISD